MATYEPDILERGLDVIFCGLNPALSAAVAGHNFSHRNNRFWAVLHLAGFTNVHLHPENERRLLEYGCGISAIIHRPTRRAEEITPEEFRKARSGFEAKMRHYAPRSIAFLGKRGFSIMTGQSDVEWGRYPIGIRRYDGVDTSQSKWPQPELHARGSCAGVFGTSRGSASTRHRTWV